VSDTILHSYGSIFDHLDSNMRNLNDAMALREEVHGVFNSLADLHQGEHAQALQAHHQQCSQQMDATICDIHANLNHAVDNQYQTASLDQQLAAGLG